MTYQLNPKDREFRAIVGIDDSAGGQGSCPVRSRTRWPSGLGESGSHRQVTTLEIRPIALNDAKKLTLIAEFGANADVADYADWCDAFVIRE